MNNKTHDKIQPSTAAKSSWWTIRPSNNMLFGITNEGKIVAGITGTGQIIKNMKKLEDLKENELVLIKNGREYERITGKTPPLPSDNSYILYSNGDLTNIKYFTIVVPVKIYPSRKIAGKFKPFIVKCITRSGSGIGIEGDMYVCVGEDTNTYTLRNNGVELYGAKCDFEKI
jgi:hypothetical protein